MQLTGAKHPLPGVGLGDGIEMNHLEPAGERPPIGGVAGDDDVLVLHPFF